jgi:hypothetical protein
MSRMYPRCRTWQPRIDGGMGWATLHRASPPPRSARAPLWPALGARRIHGGTSHWGRGCGHLVVDIHNVVFSFRSLKARDEDNDEFLPLEIRDHDEDSNFLVTDIPPPLVSRSCYPTSCADAQRRQAARLSAAGHDTQTLDIIGRPRQLRRRHPSVRYANVLDVLLEGDESI